MEDTTDTQDTIDTQDTTRTRDTTDMANTTAVRYTPTGKLPRASCRYSNCRGGTMKRYRISSLPDRRETLEVISEGASGYQVRIVREFDGYTLTDESFMSHETFGMCERTGYITIIDEPVSRHSVA